MSESFDAIDLGISSLVSESRRKNNSPRQITQEIVDIHKDFVKSELHDFPDFTCQDGTAQAEQLTSGDSSDKDAETFNSYTSFDQSLIRLAYDDGESRPNGDLSEEGDEGHQENVASKKFKSNHISIVPSFNPEEAEDKETETETISVQSHIMTPTGDTGWYEILQINSDSKEPSQNHHHPGVQKVLQTIDMSSLAQTSEGTGTETPKPTFSTPVTIQSSTNGFVCTPHPRSSQVLYITEEDSVTPESGYHPRVQSVTPLMMNKMNIISDLNKRMLNMDENGSPKDSEKVTESVKCKRSPPEIIDVDEDSAGFHPLDSPLPVEGERETHNMKERKRRARIKEACDLMRQLVPGMSEKTDKATVFEFAARYIYYLKNHVGPIHDKNFLIKYSPY